MTSPIEYCQHGMPMRYALNCEGCIDGDPDYVLPASELPKFGATDLLPRIEYPADPFREDLLIALANADLQRWPSITENTTRHMAEMMYGEQATAVLKLLHQRGIETP